MKERCLRRFRMPLPEYRWKRQLQKEEVVLLQEGKEKFELRSGIFKGNRTSGNFLIFNLKVIHLDYPNLFEKPERQGVWSGLARAGEALRRRMTGSTPASTPAYPSPDRQPTQGNLLNPTMARAMYEWTARPSLLTPTAPLRPREPEQASHTSSIPQELIMQEVRQQVSEAMKSKDGELRELRAQNEELRSALRESLDAVKDLKGGGGQRHGDLPRDRAEEPGREPGEASVGAERTGDVRGPQGLHEPRSDGDLGKSSFPSGDNKESSKVMGEDLSGLRRLIDGSHREGAGASRPLEPVQETPKVDEEEVQEPLQLLVQGMRQLQQVFLGKSESKDSELKGSVQIPQMPEAGPESAVEYADWLFEAEQAIGGLSDRSALVFGVLSCCEAHLPGVCERFSDYKAYAGGPHSCRAQSGALVAPGAQNHDSLAWFHDKDDERRYYHPSR